MARCSMHVCCSACLLLLLVSAGCGPVGSSRQGQSKLESAHSTDSVSTPQADALTEVDLDSAKMGETYAGTSSIMPQVSTTNVLLAAKSENDIAIEWQSQGEIEKFSFAAGSTVDFETSELGAPARLVVDMKGGKNIPTSQTIETANSQFIQRIRLGKHPGKDRIVFDLADAKRITHDVQFDSAGNMVVMFASTEELIAKSKQDSMHATSMAATTIAPTELAGKFDQKNNFGDTSEATNAIETAANGKAKLVKLDMQPASSGQQSQIIAEMESAGYYSLVKSAPSEYILTLEGAELSDFAAQPIVAPTNSGVIRSARAVQTGNDVQVRIFAQPESFLQASALGNQIVVTGTDLKNDNVRAQVNTEELIVEDVEETTELEVASPNAEELEVQPTTEKTSVEISENTGNDIALDSEDLFEDLLEKRYSGRLISLDLQDTDIDNALRIIAEVSNLNIIASGDVQGKVTLRLIDVPWDQALDVILKTNGLDKVQEGNVVRIAPVDKLRAEREALKQAQQAEEELEPLKVQYLRVSYARAADLQPLVESVLTERGSVTYDDRTNQLIVKDIGKGLKNVTKLVEKIDLRTPQVLIETQIIEANKTFARELGAELGFYFLRTPETGNALGYNFPNSVEIGGTAANATGQVIGEGRASSFPAGIQDSAVSMLFGSADGTRGLDLRLSQGEREGLVKVISKPSVAVTNNSPAVIKSIERIRIKLPAGGTTIGVGDGANAGAGAAGAAVATESFEVGIILNVTAQASPDYYVLMDIEAESSTLGSPGRGADNIPTEIERSATSSVLVSSGQTFAMGGIYKVSQQDQLNGVPFIKDIPIIGQFFRNSSVVTSDEELIFFITPRVVEGSFDDASMQTVS